MTNPIERIESEMMEHSLSNAYYRAYELSHYYDLISELRDELISLTYEHTTSLAGEELTLAEVVRFETIIALCAKSQNMTHQEINIDVKTEMNEFVRICYQAEAVFNVACLIKRTIPVDTIESAAISDVLDTSPIIDFSDVVSVTKLWVMTLVAKISYSLDSLVGNRHNAV